jgi:rubrerythrin
MKWKPFVSGKPYTCQDCPAYTELSAEIERLRADRDRWRHWASEYLYTDPECECPLCDEVREAYDKTV